MSSSFPKFSAELAQHAATGYHRSSGPLRRDAAVAELASLGITPWDPYVEFLATFGPGQYFAGLLFLFDLSNGPDGIRTRDAQVPAEVRAEVFPIGYDGTTAGCFCLDRRGNDPRVFWYEWDADLPQQESIGFTTWIESLPSQLFNPKIYRGYGPVKDSGAVARVIDERSSIEARLIGFDKQLVIPPGVNHQFPRYNRIVLGVTKTRPVDISRLTVRIARTGSQYGARNTDHVTFDISSAPVGVEATVSAYSFDPYNAPFESIELQYQPTIDLHSPSRTRFVEIAEYL